MSDISTETREVQPLRICNKCGWAHFPISRQFAEQQSQEFGDYITKQPIETQEMFGYGPLSRTKKEWDLQEHLSSSEHCFRCGNPHMNFRDENETDNVPNGCTLQGIIKEDLKSSQVFQDATINDIRNVASRSFEGDFDYFVFEDKVYGFVPGTNEETWYITSVLPQDLKG